MQIQITQTSLSHARIQGGGVGTGGPDPSKNHKNIGFFSNAGLDLLKSHKVTKPASNSGPLLARQRNTIYLVFRWPVNDGPLIAVFGYLLSPQKTYSKLDPI